jgi:hypothetical protein
VVAAIKAEVKAEVSKAAAVRVENKLAAAVVVAKVEAVAVVPAAAIVKQPCDGRL